MLANPIYRGVVRYEIDGKTIEAINENLRIVS